ncbi:MAG TPA: HdeD family acid-resistance protein [Streptosporangiaceae bacterium]
MEPDPGQHRQQPRQPVPMPVAAASWQAMLLFGVLTLILGLVVSIHPSVSLIVIAMLLGILMIVTGVFHLLRVFGSAEQHRVWLGTVGLLGVVIGAVLVRHLHLTVAVIGLIIGVTWIAQGISALMVGMTGERGGGRAWWTFFGFIGVIAGVVALASPVVSVTALAVLFGIWFAVMGLSEIIGALMFRRAAISQQRAGLGVAGERHPGGAPTGSPAG